MSQVFDITMRALLGAARHHVKEPGNSKAGAMREALLGGPMSARQLAAVAGTSAKLVQALLKLDIKRGRILRRQGADGLLYELAAAEYSWDARTAGRIAAAVRLLRGLGYIVQPPSAPPTK
jgi:hypothetical protein